MKAKKNPEPILRFGAQGLLKRLIAIQS